MDDFNCLGVFYLINKQKPHKPKSFRVSGYRAAHKIHDNYLTTRPLPITIWKMTSYMPVRRQLRL